MLIGVPKEIKPDEYRVALTPAGTETLTLAGHQVVIEADAGLGSGFTDDFYAAAGAEILNAADEIWFRAEMVMKVKEPIEPEWPKIREGQVLFTYLHLASSLKLTEALRASGAVAIAYETVEMPDRELPLLTPMSEVAGRISKKGRSTWSGMPVEGAFCSGAYPACSREGRDLGWGCGRDERSPDGRGVGRDGGDPRRVSPASSVSRRNHAGQRQFAFLDPVLDSETDPGRRPRDRGGPPARGQGSEPNRGGRPEDDEARFRDRRCGGGSGWVRGHDSAYDTR